MPDRLYLSPPHIGPDELALVTEAFETNWVAPVGPHVDAFEREFAAYVGAEHAVALSSGTAALHLALRDLGVGPGDEVAVSTLTFCASVNPILYEGATPVFVDSERRSWNLDPTLVEDLFRDRAAKGRQVKALVPVHLYGQTADLGALVELCDRYGVPMIEDAAEALGARYQGEESQGQSEARDRALNGGSRAAVPERSRGESRGAEGPVAGPPGENEAEGLSPRGFGSAQPPPDRGPSAQGPGGGRSPGTFGRAGIFSFNGNKIITTSGGGMLVTDRAETAAHVKKMATQARDAAPHYEHSEVGYNYRLSNVLAGIGRGQLRQLDHRVAARRRVFDAYVDALGDLPGVAFMPEASWGTHTRWLTCLTLDPEAAGATREDVRRALEADDVEARPVWKPMHLQPVYAGYEAVGGAVAEDLFDRGLCLPSGSGMTEADVERVVTGVRAALGVPSVPPENGEVPEV
ncbi:DegT/DnrJ/EryC1/StrS family aminotransferase [Rubrivirga marina]|uniref:Pyridoxal phosphate-dependent aminotransferase n=1 Tax=Rubrivirga marina TaxID=1196024 RepID=A0A271J017_9BACT|nr:aminotransferase class I/II-fold pyridoxal phosphate-dependent enzyme [Rubrivirga marina]PAP76394.1 pyridoxal phosphate-dependent aminotransferase [Rubrivirga marina]